MEMSKEELVAFIKESLKETAFANQLSAEDESYDEADFEDSLGIGGDDYYGDDMNAGLEPLSIPTGNPALTQGGNNSYDDEFSDLNGYKEFGSDYQVNPQDLPSVFSEEELAEMIREGVNRLHKQKIIENRIEQINQELNALNNPEAWKGAKEEARNQLRKKTIGFTNMIPKERLVSEYLDENKYSDVASNFIGKKISHPQDAAINITKNKSYKVPSNKRDGISEIMNRANDLMAEANKRMNKNK